MKWRIDKSEPKDFEKRQRVIFAIFPNRTTDGYRVWLEPVISNEFYGPLTHSWRRDTYTAIHF